MGQQMDLAACRARKPPSTAAIVSQGVRQQIEFEARALRPPNPRGQPRGRRIYLQSLQSKA